MAFLIPSSSRICITYITVLSPLSDLVGVSSQLILTAYQLELVLLI
ncbi:hypothetical protein Q5M85_14025 [Paraclostridium bifermentans]|nr:hypothetical protein [Paraclostridium bifermentans]